MALLADSPNLSRPGSSSRGSVTSSSLGGSSKLADLSVDQQKALARLEDYPNRIKRLKKLWIDVNGGGPMWKPPPSSGSLSRPTSAGGISRRSTSVGGVSSRLATAGAQTMASKPQAATRANASTNSGSRSKSTGRSGPAAHGAALTQAQIRELMNRELTPEDYELLLLLDEGIKKSRTLSAAAAASLPKAQGAAWVGESCGICLCDLETDEDVRCLPKCGHCFHANCAAHWLGKSKASCPLCGIEVSE